MMSGGWMNNTIKRTWVIMCLPFIGMLLGASVLMMIRFGPPDASKAAMPFSPPDIRITQRQIHAAAGLTSPVTIAKKKEFPQVPLSQIAPPPGGTAPQVPAKADRKVSLILVRGGVKSAIINGIVVREGDKIDNAVVSKIEKSRVLVKDKTGEEWINME